MNKSIKKVTIEAFIVGLFLTILFGIILVIMTPILKNNHMIHMLLSVFIAGGLFHIICEYTNVNIWYSKQYCDIIKYCEKNNIPSSE